MELKLDGRMKVNEIEVLRTEQKWVSWVSFGVKEVDKGEHLLPLLGQFHFPSDGPNV